MSLNKIFRILSLVLPALILSPISAHAEDVNLSTYYPSPYGSYRRLSIEDVGSDANVYGSLQIIREAAGHLGSHIAFIRDNTSRMGLGYEQSSDTFGFGPAANATTTAFQPTLLSIDATGEVGIGTNNPQARLHATTENATTNTVTDILRINHSSTNIPTTNFGTGLLLTGSSATVNNRNMARIQSTWTTATDASRTSSLQFQTEDNAAANLTTHMTLNSAGLDVSADGGSILVPRKTSSGDPTGTNGMIYYNAVDNKFRVYQNGVWANMATGSAGGAPVMGTVSWVTPVTNTSVNVTPTQSIVLPSGGNYNVAVWGTYFSCIDYTTHLQIDGSTVATYSAAEHNYGNENTAGCDQNTIMTTRILSGGTHTINFQRPSGDNASSANGIAEAGFLWIAYPQ